MGPWQRRWPASQSGLQLKTSRTAGQAPAHRGPGEAGALLRSRQAGSCLLLKLLEGLVPQVRSEQISGDPSVPASATGDTRADVSFVSLRDSLYNCFICLKMFVSPFNIPLFSPEIASIYEKKATDLGDPVGQEDR